MNYLPKFYQSVEQATEMRDAAVKILKDIDEGQQKEKLQEDIWDLNDIIANYTQC